MAIQSPTQPAGKLLDKRALQKSVAELDQRMGFVPDPTATAEKAQAMMLARGIRPEISNPCAWQTLLIPETWRMKYGS